MALSGTISKSITGRKYYISWSATQSVSGNYSTITCKHYLQNDSTYSLYINGRTNSCTVDGTSKSYTSSSISTSGGSTIHLGTTTHTVYHNSDGTKSVTIKGVFNIQATLSGTYYSSLTASGTVTLNTIPRASTPTVSGTKSLGSTMTITTNRASSSFTHTLTWAWADKSGTIKTGVGASTTWTPSVETFAPYLTSATSGTCTITCTTYSGSTNIGSKTVSFALAIPSSVVPSISSVIASDAKGYADKYGAYIQNRSSVKVVTSASGIYSSTIETYAVTMDSLSGSSSSCTIGTPANTGTRTITSKVTDTRGRTASKTASIKVVAYSAPSISSLSAYRAVDGVADDTSTTVRVVYGAVVTDINGAGANSKNLKIAWVSESNSSSATITLGSYNVSNGTYDITGIPTDETCAITLTLTDDITNATRSANVGTAEPLLNFSPNGRALGIGAIADEDADGVIDLGWTLQTPKQIRVEYPSGAAVRVSNPTTGYAVGLGIQSSSGTLRGLYDVTGDRWMVYTDESEPLYTKMNRLHLTGTTDVSGTADNDVPLIIGNRSGYHLIFDGNEIHAKDSATTMGTLALNADGGSVSINGNVVSDVVTAKSAAARTSWSYIKFASGLAICWKTYAYSEINITNAYGNGYYRNCGSFAFPFTFVDEPNVQITVWSGTGLLGASVNTLTTSDFKFYLTSTSSLSGITPDIFWLVTGRWK